jgi:hypothetical protein
MLSRSESKVLRRRPSIEQGRALESLGHAIEYIYDSQVYHSENGVLSQGDMEAVQILMRLSREVFNECKEVAPAASANRGGIKHWLRNLLYRRTA